ncbi:Putative cyclophilin-type peptidyl-prolyl cis-trans isomerase domain-containing protein [Septoria linicola]|uniref:Cyclophilin-type peptidyl-prolyl cis-trans isomerase domain-containing protein n=1 Tax=Septoria linicola TaxID=215465 RepID=A0A9Q9ANT3_9PEZI|nr:Putative cyclophilin-type peptidyl-prolyl cis-trans isomerase domain-containing protein [Septoria linicola]
MAALYNLEPQPTAKVVLNTTFGDVQLEIFAKQCPLAGRNFLQHCLDGYYNNTVFHRLVPGFIVQGGDPTGTGSGGISAINHGDAFEDEFHTRLKFNRRGLLGMANEGPNTNGSQFFLTLGATPELQGRNTMFGRVEGDTIYNLMKMADTELVGLEEGSERPLYPTRVTGAEVLVNPFEDMVARVKEAPRSQDEGKKEVKKRKKPLGKQVLSFGDDEEDAAPVVKKVKANPKLVAVEEEVQEKPSVKAPKQKKVKAMKQDEPMLDVEEPAAAPAKAETKPKPQADDDEEDEYEDDAEVKRQKQLESTNAQIAALKASMKRTVDTGPKQKEKPKSALEATIPTTSTRGRKRGKASDERGAMDLFKQFKSRLEDLPDDKGSEDNADGGADTTNGHSVAPTTTEAEADDEEAALCDLHFIANCQSCKAWDDNPEGEAEDDADDDVSWMAKKLTFAKDTLGKDLEWKRKMDEIQVIDPREKEKDIMREKRKGKSERKMADEDRVRSKR